MSTAAKFFKGVPDPQPIIDAIIAHERGSERERGLAKSKIKGAISVYKTIPKRAKVVKLLERVLYG